MDFKPLQIGDIEIKYPLVQGGMGIGVSLSQLAISVTENGGLGIISAAQIGYKDENFENKPFECNLKALREHIQYAKSKVLDKPIGVNIMAATDKYDDFVKCSIDAGVDIIISGAGLPINLPKLVKGTKTKFAPIVSSVKATSLLLRMWERKDNTTCDMIVVENHLAGGHLGFKESQVEEYLTQKDFDEEFKAIVEFVKTYEEKFYKKIPVIYAGGVFDKVDVEKCFKLGASGVQMGTRFVTTVECDASDEFKQAYINAKEEDIMIVKSPVGLPGRALKNAFTCSNNREDITKCYKCLPKCDISTTPYCISNKLMTSVLGDTNNGLVFCGANAHKCNKIENVKDIFDELFI